MPDVTLSLVPWEIGADVGAYPRRSEQMLPDQPPTMVPAAETQQVADDASLTFTSLPDGEYWAAAPLGADPVPTLMSDSGTPWHYIAFNVETPGDVVGPPGPPGPEGPPGPGADIPLVGVLPTDPDDGAEIYFQTTDMAVKGIIWRLRYTDGGQLRWQFAGGSPLRLYDATERQVSNPVFQYAGSQQIAVPLLGDYEVALSSEWGSTSSGSTVIPAVGVGVNGVVDNNALYQHKTDTLTEFPRSGFTGVVLRLDEGAIVRPMLRVDVPHQAFTRKTAITLLPIRVGALDV